MDKIDSSPSGQAPATVLVVGISLLPLCGYILASSSIFSQFLVMRKQQSIFVVMSNWLWEWLEYMLFELLVCCLSSYCQKKYCGCLVHLMNHHLVVLKATKQ